MMMMMMMSATRDSEAGITFRRTCVVFKLRMLTNFVDANQG